MLEAAGQTPESERSSRAEPLSEPEAAELLRSVQKVVVCRGRKTIEIAPRRATPDDLKGPTGNFRAPLLHVDETLVVGFNRETLADLFGQAAV